MTFTILLNENATIFFLLGILIGMLEIMGWLMIGYGYTEKMARGINSGLPFILTGIAFTVAGIFVLLWGTDVISIKFIK